MTDMTAARDDTGPSSAWWLLMVLGTLCIIVGVVVIAKPSDSLETLAVIVGIFMFVDGMIEIGLAIARRGEGTGVVALVGVLNAVIGIALVRHPVEGVTFIALLIAIWLVALGVVRFVGAFGSPVHRMWNIVIALVEVGAGVAIMVDPNIGYATLALLVGIAFILRGMAFVGFGVVLHAAKQPAAMPSTPAGAAPA
jgi:uncharacterized membrane protein HdeD (DUF308 family)